MGDDFREGFTGKGGGDHAVGAVTAALCGGDFAFWVELGLQGNGGEEKGSGVRCAEEGNAGVGVGGGDQSAFPDLVVTEGFAVAMHGVLVICSVGDVGVGIRGEDAAGRGVVVVVVFELGVVHDLGFAYAFLALSILDSPGNKLGLGGDFPN